MARSDCTANLAKALAAAQKNMKPVFKGSVNPHFKSRYADYSSIIEVAIPALSAQGLALTHATAILGTEVVCETTLLHESGEWISSVYPLRPMKQDPQAWGSCLTYAKRYTASALLAIADSDDDDANAAMPAPTVKPSTNKEAPNCFTVGAWSGVSWSEMQGRELNSLMDAIRSGKMKVTNKSELAAFGDFIRAKQNGNSNKEAH